MNSIGIFGTSGFAREVGDIAWALGYTPVYIARDEDELMTGRACGEALLESELNRLKDTAFVIGIGENLTRQKIAQRYADKLNFINLLHPSASFGQQQREIIERSRGNIVCAGVRFTNNIQVGNFSIFNLNATIGHDCVIEDFANIAPGANISGNVHIGARCWIGTGAVINQGADGAKLSIGGGTTVGSGSVVVKSCDQDAVYVGIPAKRIK